MPTRVRSHAKINLGLGIGALRPDGFHGLTTLYQTLEIFDAVTVRARRAAATSLCLTSNDNRVPCDSRNTAWKLVLLALKELGVTAEVEIHIEKRLPVQGGLGAGSANAVAALIGLEQELEIAEKGRALPSFEQRSLEGWDTGEDWARKRIEIAAQVGSDVPLFLIGGTVLGIDRGQRVYALPDLEPLWCALAIPRAGVSTPHAFRDWDALCAAEGLTAEASADKLKRLSHAYLSAFGIDIPEEGESGSSGVLAKTSESGRKDLAGPIESALVRTGITSWIENDFERVVFRQHPSLAEIKRLLAAPDTPERALYAALSGSGSALFGLYQSRESAKAAEDRLRDRFKRLEEVEVQITRTLGRDEYWREMILE